MPSFNFCKISGGQWLKHSNSLPLKRDDFDPSYINSDLHKRVTDSIKDGFIRRVDKFDMQVSSKDRELKWNAEEGIQEMMVY